MRYQPTITSTTQTANVPSQSWRSSHVQFGGGPNDRFVTAIERFNTRRRPDARDGALAREGPALLLLAGERLAARRPLVLVLSGANLPKPTIPLGHHSQRPYRRCDSQHHRLPRHRHHLRRTEPARRYLGQLPSRATRASPAHAARRPKTPDTHARLRRVRSLDRLPHQR